MKTQMSSSVSIPNKSRMIDLVLYKTIFVREMHEFVSKYISMRQIYRLYLII